MKLCPIRRSQLLKRGDEPTNAPRPSDRGAPGIGVSEATIGEVCGRLRLTTAAMGRLDDVCSPCCLNPRSERAYGFGRVQWAVNALPGLQL
jgi:hypothetical protein